MRQQRQVNLLCHVYPEECRPWISPPAGLAGESETTVSSISEMNQTSQIRLAPVAEPAFEISPTQTTETAPSAVYSRSVDRSQHPSLHVANSLPMGVQASAGLLGGSALSLSFLSFFVTIFPSALI